MNVLIVCSGNNYKVSAFITEQVASLKKKGIKADFFLIKGKLLGYLMSVFMLRELLKNSKYNIVHAHFGLSGLVAVQQRICPVVISFIGSDVNRNVQRILSRIAMRLSFYNIFVDQRLSKKMNATKSYSNIPFGVDFDKNFFPMSKKQCRKKLNLNLKSKIVLFSSRFNHPDKNYDLARSAVKLLENVELIELSDKYSREQVCFLLNACDLVLMTSLREGSPQVIKEAMACNCPIVSTNVGDVKDVIDGTKGCYITTFDPIDVADKIKLAFAFNKKTDGREKIKHLDNNIIAEKVISVYNKILFN